MEPKFVARVATTALLLWAGEAIARAPGDAQKGEVVARRSCSGCHAVDGSRPSPNPRAPPFVDVAQIPGMTAIALRAALQTSHRSMPNLVLAKPDREDVIAYILQLKASGGRSGRSP